MDEETNTIGAHLINSKLNFSVDYEVHLNPPILEDEGTMVLTSESLSFETDV